MGVNVESPDATSVLRREMHGQRARQVLQVALWLLVGVESIWAVLGFVDGQVWLALVDGMTALGAATLLALPGMTTRMRAHCTFWLFFLFVWATLLLVDGLGVAHQGTNQIWFIAAALITLLVLFDEAQAVRVGYIAVCVLSFVGRAQCLVDAGHALEARHRESQHGQRSPPRTMRRCVRRRRIRTHRRRLDSSHAGAWIEPS